MPFFYEIPNHSKVNPSIDGGRFEKQEEVDSVESGESLLSIDRSSSASLDAPMPPAFVVERDDKGQLVKVHFRTGGDFGDRYDKHPEE